MLNGKMSNFSNEFATHSGQLQRYLNDLIFSQKYLRATSTQSYAIDKAQTAIDETAWYQVKMGIMGAIAHSIREPFAVGVLSLLILLVLKTEMVDMEAIFIPLVLYYRGLNAILTTQVYLQNTLEFMGSAYKVISQLVSLNKNISEQEVGLIPIDNWQLIHAPNLSYEYVPGVPVLKDVSFEIKRNQVVGVVGRSGSGKTTLVDLITGLTPSSLMVDDMPLSKVRDWGKSIGYVSQDVKLIDGSVQENITLQNSSEVNYEVLREALRTAQLEKMIEKLPRGLNSLVVDHGAGLSGGEKQRILIARALYRQPKLLIFDEATSALDNETEYSLRQSLEALKGKVTILIVAHRLSTVRFCDNIIVLENGKIVESGTYLKLSMEVNSKFSKLIAAESRGT
jgi:subfamily B ATP-binding cassette protein MsbA